MYFELDEKEKYRVKKSVNGFNYWMAIFKGNWFWTGVVNNAHSFNTKPNPSVYRKDINDESLITIESI